jgi:hypothetical protein
MKIEPRLLDEIKARMNLADVIREDGHELRRSGDHAVCICPFHEDRTASFNVWNDHAHCFGCTVHIGDVIDYWMRTRGCDFRTAVEQLAARTGVIIPCAATGRTHKRVTPRPSPPNPPPKRELERPLPPDFYDVCRRARWGLYSHPHRCEAVAKLFGLGPGTIRAATVPQTDAIGWAEEPLPIGKGWSIPDRIVFVYPAGLKVRHPFGDEREPRFAWANGSRFAPT